MKGSKGGWTVDDREERGTIPPLPPRQIDTPRKKSFPRPCVYRVKGVYIWKQGGKSVGGLDREKHSEYLY